MKKFENGDEVEITNVFDDNYVLANYIGANEDNHVCVLNGSLLNVSDRYIRPKQLICDKAINSINKAMNMEFDIKLKFNSDKEFEEYLKTDLRNDVCLPSVGWQTIARKSGVCIKDSVVHYMTEEDMDLPELILTTGEIIPVEGKDAMKPTREDIEFLHTQLKEKDKVIAEYKDHYDNHMHKISNLDNLCESALKELNGKDKVIAEYKDHYDSHMHKIFNLDNLYESAFKELKEQDDEINSLKEEIKGYEQTESKRIYELERMIEQKDKLIEKQEKSNDEMKEEIEQLKRKSENFDNLLSLRNVIYELANAPYGRTFDLKKCDETGNEFDITVRY